MSDLQAYRALCAGKRPQELAAGLTKIPRLERTLFDHQRHGVEFALRAGRSGLFYDTGLGKTAMMLEWGRVIVEHTNKPVLMLAPLAVGAQHVREADRLMIEARLSRFGTKPDHPCIAITNYERLDKFDPSDYAGVILDESSILKSFTGKTTRKLIQAFQHTPFRLAGTATPAPNDHTELGQHAEFLGVMDRDEMLVRWFLHDSLNTKLWRLKGHAVRPFWDWVASWARCVSKPSDLGFSDAGFELPELDIQKHIVAADRSINSGEEKDGQARLFRIPDRSATSIHKEKRLTIKARARIVAEIVFKDWSCGSQNTPPADARAAALSGLGLDEIQPRSLPLEAQSETSNAAPDMRSTPSTAKNAKRQRGNGRQKSGETDDSRLSSESTPQNTIDCSPSSSGPALSAGSQKAARSEASDCISTTATQAGQCVASFAPTAIRASENSAMISGSCGTPSNTSPGRDWWIVWCDTDYDQDEVEAQFGSLAVSIKGSQSADQKEELHEIWLSGEKKILICKPAMFGYGLNWQHCCKMVFCGLSFSYERFYQAIRRCWRFRQLRPVTVHLVCADTELEIAATVDRKSHDHDRMKAEMAAAMLRASKVHKTLDPYHPNQEGRLPAWLS